MHNSTRLAWHDRYMYLYRLGFPIDTYIHVVTCMGTLLTSHRFPVDWPMPDIAAQHVTSSAGGRACSLPLPPSEHVQIHTVLHVPPSSSPPLVTATLRCPVSHSNPPSQCSCPPLGRSHVSRLPLIVENVLQRQPSSLPSPRFLRPFAFMTTNTNTDTPY